MASRFQSTCLGGRGKQHDGEDNKGIVRMRERWVVIRIVMILMILIKLLFTEKGSNISHWIEKYLYALPY